MAIKRGVKTRVILETWNDLNPQASENNKVRQALQMLGADVRMSKKGVIMHSKTWIFDNKRLIIGSHNSTEAGLCRTKNLSIITEEATDTKAYEAYFEKEWQDLAPLQPI